MKIVNLILVLGILVIGLIFFGCIGSSQAKPNQTNQTNQSNQTIVVTCEEYCPTQPHIQCVGTWNISGTYPDCNCQYNCQVIETSPQNITTQPELPALANIDVINYAFDPSTIEVTKGAVVTWMNKDSVIHTIISDTGAFSSDMIYTGRTFNYTFDTVGTYNYHCGIYQTMKGTIIVK